MFSRDFKEFIALLNENKVQYLIVGGYAVALHGHPRYTKDLDVWINCEPTNAKAILKALRDFGFGSLNLSENDFMQDDQVIQLGYPPNRIDILLFASGLDFDNSFKKRQLAEIDGINVSFLDIDSLRINKKATGRLQDLADLEHLK